uniref:Uncharacterized protein n=1 Tax=Parascaris univalens TaxID=6257 RepID=A0A914ZVR2_PARUN
LKCRDLMHEMSRNVEAFAALSRKLDDVNLRLQFQKIKMRYLETETCRQKLIREGIKKDRENISFQLKEMESEFDVLMRSCTTTFHEKTRLDKAVTSANVRSKEASRILSRLQAIVSKDATTKRGVNAVAATDVEVSDASIANEAISVLKQEMENVISAVVKFAASAPSEESLNAIRERANRLRLREAAHASRTNTLREVTARIGEKEKSVMEQRRKLDVLSGTSASLSERLVDCAREAHNDDEMLDVLEKRWRTLSSQATSKSSAEEENERKELQAEVALLEARIEERRREAEEKEEELSRCVDAVVTSRALVKSTEAQLKLEIDAMAKELEESKQRSNQLADEISSRRACLEMRREREMQKRELESVQRLIEEENIRKASIEEQLQSATSNLEQSVAERKELKATRRALAEEIRLLKEEIRYWEHRRSSQLVAAEWRSHNDMEGGELEEAIEEKFGSLVDGGIGEVRRSHGTSIEEIIFSPVEDRLRSNATDNHVATNNRTLDGEQKERAEAVVQQMQKLNWNQQSMKITKTATLSRTKRRSSRHHYHSIRRSAEEKLRAETILQGKCLKVKSTGSRSNLFCEEDGAVYRSSLLKNQGRDRAESTDMNTAKVRSKVAPAEVTTFVAKSRLPRKLPIRRRYKKHKAPTFGNQLFASVEDYTVTTNSFNPNELKATSTPYKRRQACSQRAYKADIAREQLKNRKGTARRDTAITQG